MNGATVEVTFFLFFHENGRMLQPFLKQTTAPKKAVLLSNSLTLPSETPCLFLQGMSCLVTTATEAAGKARGKKGALSVNRDAEQAGVRANSCLRRLEMHLNYFQKVWAWQHPESIFHLLEVPQVVVIKGTSKPHISDLSGRTKSKRSFLRRKGWGWSTGNRFLASARLSFLLRC